MAPLAASAPLTSASRRTKRRPGRSRLSTQASASSRLAWTAGAWEVSASEGTGRMGTGGSGRKSVAVQKAGAGWMARAELSILVQNAPVSKMPFACRIASRRINALPHRGIPGATWPGTRKGTAGLSALAAWADPLARGSRAMPPSGLPWAHGPALACSLANRPAWGAGAKRRRERCVDRGFAAAPRKGDKPAAAGRQAGRCPAGQRKLDGSLRQALPGRSGAPCLQSALKASLEAPA